MFPIRQASRPVPLQPLQRASRRRKPGRSRGWLRRQNRQPAGGRLKRSEEIRCPGIEILIDILIVVSSAQTHHRGGAELNHRRLNFLSNSAEMLVLAVTQAEDAKGDACCGGRSGIGSGGGGAQPRVEICSVVRGLAVAVRSHQEEHQLFFVEALRGLVVLNVDDIECSRGAVLGLELRFERLCEALSGAGLGAKEDGGALAGVRGWGSLGSGSARSAGGHRCSGGLGGRFAALVGAVQDQGGQEGDTEEQQADHAHRSSWKWNRNNLGGHCTWHRGLRAALLPYKSCNEMTLA